MIEDEELEGNLEEIEVIEVVVFDGHDYSSMESGVIYGLKELENHLCYVTFEDETTRLVLSELVKPCGESVTLV